MNSPSCPDASRFVLRPLPPLPLPLPSPPGPGPGVSQPSFLRPAASSVSKKPGSSSASYSPIAADRTSPGFRHEEPWAADPEIYEPLYDSRWRLMNLEAYWRLAAVPTFTRPVPTTRKSLRRPEDVNNGPATPSGGRPPAQFLCPRSNAAYPALLGHGGEVLERRYVIPRCEGGFGFTLRHLIVYPPKDDEFCEHSTLFPRPVDTIFVKDVKKEGPAFYSGLKIGDRIVRVYGNGTSVGNKSYAEVVHFIQKTTTSLELICVPRQHDLLQLFYPDIVENPETNCRGCEQDGALMHHHNPDFVCAAIMPRSRGSTSQPALCSRSPPSSSSSSTPTSRNSLRPPDPVLPFLGCDHAYAVPAQVRSDDKSVGSLVSLASGSTSLTWPESSADDASSVATITPQGDPDPVMSRIIRECQLKEKFLQRPHLATSLPDKRPLPSCPNEEPLAAAATPSESTAATSTTSQSKSTNRNDQPDISDGPSRLHFNFYGLQLGYRPSASPAASGNVQTEGATSAADEGADEDEDGGDQYGIYSRPVMQSPFSPAVVSPNPQPENSPKGQGRSSAIITSAASCSVVRRKKQAAFHGDEDEERNLRRVSYLKATKEDRIQTESDSEGDKEEDAEARGTSDIKGADGPKPAHSISKILALFGEKADLPTTPPTLPKHPASDAPDPVSEPIEDAFKEGWLTVKLIEVDGRKSVDRSWKNLYVVLKPHHLYLFKDYKSALDGQCAYEEAPVRLVDIHIDLAEDYTKRKNVFRIRSERATQYLLQADSEHSLQLWMQAIEDRKRVCGAGQKSATSRNRSPTGQSPATKNRKASSAEQTAPFREKDSSKKTWKGKVAKQWKKMHSSGGSAPQASAYLEGASIGVPLDYCPMCAEPDMDRVPWLVKVCCSIVEERGLETVGIYRVPGNSAAVTHLSELVNKGDAEQCKLDDPRWNDVNVVSSLLKSFFRKLPDPLFTLELYSVFIEASKIEDSVKRLRALKKLIHSLPEIHFDTLKFVSYHLCKVIQHSEVNKMEIRNLAIVFGPTLVRTSDDNMWSMVTDMAQQCRIIESILSNCEWFFSQDEGDTDPVEYLTTMDVAIDLTPTTEITQTGNQSLLLTNLQKLEDAGKVSSPNRDISAKDIVSGIISAANRKMLRAASGSATAKPKKDSVDSIAIPVAPAGELTKPQSQRPEQQPQRPDADSSSELAAVGSAASSSSRRNSESVLHGAMTIVAAVPQLVTHLVSAQQHQIVHSNVSMSSSDTTATSTDSTTITTTTVAGVTVTSGDTRPTAARHHQEEEDLAPSSCKFPIETYQGLEEATAERIRRFEDETRAMLRRSRMDFQPAVFNRVTSESRLDDTWGNELAGGILMQEPYLTSAYNSSAAHSIHTGQAHHQQDVAEQQAPPTAAAAPPHSHFVNLTYLSPGSGSSRLYAAQPKLQTVPSGQELVPDSAADPEPKGDSDRLTMPNDDSGDSLIQALTVTFDEKLRLLLDPHYQSSGSQSDSSVQSTPSGSECVKRRTSLATAAHPPDMTFKTRSISLGTHNPALELLLQAADAKAKKSELKRSKLVAKTRCPHTKQGHPVAGKHLCNLSNYSNSQESGPNSGLCNEDCNHEDKENEEKENQHRRVRPLPIRRRHTVGGTKDFSQWQKDDMISFWNNHDLVSHHSAASGITDGVHQSSASGHDRRRFSLQEPPAGALTSVPSLLESRV